MKSGISLIAVLMFMLAATTASVVVFKWIGTENFSSAARLKNNEAYQASQAGLEALRGWLTNKGADAGALVRTFELNNPTKPVLLVSTVKGSDLNLLADIQGSNSTNKHKQNFEVCLTEATTDQAQYKFKFLSVGYSRDGSKYSQTAIFDVEGLYKMKAKGLPPTAPAGGGGAPTYFGAVGEGTQGTATSMHVLGDLKAQSGFSTTGELIVTGSYTMASGAKIGCPIKNNDPNQQLYSSRPSNYDALVKDSVFGDAYVKENLSAQESKYCGSLRVDGDMSVDGPIEIWGDLYVKGNLNLNQKITVHGNVTIVGNITFLQPNGDVQTATMDFNFKKNLLLAGQNSTYGTPAKKITVDGTTCKVGSNTPPAPVSNTVQTKSTEQECKSIVGGANPLDNLGDQITLNKWDNNGNKCTITGPNCMYRINDHIVLGAADKWEKATLDGLSCSELKKFLSGDIFDIKVEMDYNKFLDEANKCHNKGAVGNWKDSYGKNWLVLRVEWSSDGIKFNGTLGKLSANSDIGNFIIVVENKPNLMFLPKTTQNTNVLLYLKEGANNIKIENRNSGDYYNYFIYSAKDIERIDGSQYITGNLFMANGAKVKAMQDPKMEDNTTMYKALIEAGIIKDNEFKCKDTKNDRGDGRCKDGGGSGYNFAEERPEIPVPPGVPDPKDSYVPSIPHLKVTMQNVYTNTEGTECPKDSKAQPAILVTPRVIYLKPNQLPANNTALAKYFKLLYLNGATPPSETYDLGQHIKNCSYPLEAGESKICNIDLSGVADIKCNGSPLCNNAFYIVVEY